MGFFVPSAISLILDYFPPSRQTTAIAFFGVAEQVAGGLVSLTTLMIVQVGWRMTYLEIGAIFSLSGIVGLFVIREPVRNQFNFQHNSGNEEGFLSTLNGIKQVISVPCIRWNLAANFFKYANYTIISSFSLLYFNRYKQVELFAIVNLILSSTGGIFSPFFYAYMCERFEPCYIKAKSHLSALQSGLAAAFYFQCYYKFHGMT